MILSGKENRNSGENENKERDNEFTFRETEENAEEKARIGWL